MVENEIMENIERMKTDDELYNKIDSHIKRVKIHFIGDLAFGITNFIIINYSDMPFPIKVVSTSLLSLPLFKFAWNDYKTYKEFIYYKNELKNIDNQLEDIKNELLIANEISSKQSKLSDYSCDYYKTYQKQHQ